MPCFMQEHAAALIMKAQFTSLKFCQLLYFSNLPNLLDLRYMVYQYAYYLTMISGTEATLPSLNAFKGCSSICKSYSKWTRHTTIQMVTSIPSMYGVHCINISNRLHSKKYKWKVFIKYLWKILTDRNQQC